MMYRLLVACCLVSLSAAPALAAVKLPAVFSDHMVLQKRDSVPVWGKADPSEAITITVAGQTAQATADASGKWKTTLNLKDAGPGPHEMQVKGTNTLVIQDVVIGEVWVASGQSNMDWTLDNATGVDAERARPANPLLREFKVARNPINTPQEDCQGSWVVAAPDTISRFSAVGYYFSRRLQEELKVPVGIVNTSFGGTHSETWTSMEAIATDPVLETGRKQLIAELESYPQRLIDYDKQRIEWQKKTGREDRPAGDPATYAAPSVDTSDWKTVTMPAGFEQAGLPDAGAVWLRRSVPIDASRANQELRVELGRNFGFDTAYWNGVPLKKLPYDSDAVSAYSVPATPEGEAILAVRIYSPFGGAGIQGSAGSFRIGNGPSNLFFLPGEWKAKVENTLPPMDEATKASIPVWPGAPPRPQNVPSSLYNGMVNPLVPYAIRGAIWYQGESNTSRAVAYRSAFALMINDWRKQWGQGDFPFYWAQLANFEPKQAQPGDSRWAELRDAQTATLALPNTGQAILIDIGEEADIHPRNKADVGHRLARIALARDYGKSVPYVGPTFDSMKVEGNQVRVLFKHAKGLKAHPLPATYQPRTIDPTTKPLVRNSPGGQLEGFAVCGADKQWHWADASIDGESVVVHSAAVAQPIAVRYAWADNPTTNLYNDAGLPAVPFRTDDFPLSTANTQFPN